MTPLKPAPELLADGTDVARETERGLIIRALNAVMQLQEQVDGGFGRIASELAGYARRIGILEGRNIDPESSYNDLRTTFLDAADTAYRRGKDDRDPLTMRDAKTIARIAQEAVQTARNASDARALRGLRSRGWDVALVFLSAALGIVGGALAAHYGWAH